MIDLRIDPHRVATSQLLVAIVLAAALGSATTTAQTTGAANDQTQTSAEAQRIIDRALDAYRALDSYQDRRQSKLTLVVIGSDGAAKDMSRQFSGSSVFVRPNKFRFSSQDVEIVCNGKQLWAYVQSLRQYTETVVGDPLDLDQALAKRFTAPTILKVLLSSDQDLRQLFPAVNELTSAVAETRDGRQGHRVQGSVDLAILDVVRPAAISMWFDAETGLLGQLHIDATKAAKQVSQQTASNPGSKVPVDGDVENAQLLVEYVDVKINEPIADDQFLFQPPSDARKVDVFAKPQQRPPQGDGLIGQFAPTFRRTMLDGSVFKLTDMRGQVVVLDFWATWCRPCAAAMPALQALHERYEGKGAMIIGVSVDGPGSRTLVKRFLANRRLTFPQIIDTQGSSSIAARYGVTAIPTTVVIGPDGIVQDVHEGYSRGMDKVLAGKIEALLGGDGPAGGDQLW